MHPPLPLLFAAWIGVKPKQYGTTEELLQQMAGLSGR
jgi:hypothetical protein